MYETRKILCLEVYETRTNGGIDPYIAYRRPILYEMPCQFCTRKRPKTYDGLYQQAQDGWLLGERLVQIMFSVYQHRPKQISYCCM